MFKIKIDNETHLELTHFSHAEEILALVNQNKELFKEWLLWIDHIQTVEEDKTALFIDCEKF